MKSNSDFYWPVLTRPGVAHFARPVTAMAAKIDKDTCTGCEVCVGVCPTEAIAMKDGVAVVSVSEGACVDCGACVGEGPCDAITMS